MARKMILEKTFKLTDDVSVDCYYQNTNYGFRHVAELSAPGVFVTDKCRYYNRTWESYEFESVLYAVVEKAEKKKFFTKEQAETCKKYIKDYEEINRQEVNKKFGMIGAIASLGSIFTDNKADSNAFKKRILKAGVGDGLDFPDDWNELSEEDKENRLNGAINILK